MTDKFGLVSSERDRVSSLELSKKIKELGVKQDSLFYWVKDFDGCKGWQLFVTGQMCGQLDDHYEFSKEHLSGYEFYSAFTVAELGEMLPEGYMTKREGKRWRGAGFDIADGSIIADTEANARAKMLIYLVDKGKIR